jgi:hypothetical protein
MKDEVRNLQELNIQKVSKTPVSIESVWNLYVLLTMEI